MKKSNVFSFCCTLFVLLFALNLSGCSAGEASSSRLSASSQTASAPEHPEQIAFSDGYNKANVVIEKVKISNGNTGKSFETTDQKKIHALFDKLDTQTLTYKGEDRAFGWMYAIDCTCKGMPGYFCYVHGHGFTSFNGYPGKLIKGLYVVDGVNLQGDLHDDFIYVTLRDFFNELSKGK